MGDKERREFVALTVNVFSPIIHNIIIQFRGAPSMTDEDLEQEALSALWKAIGTYNPKKGSLRNFAWGVVSRHMRLAVGPQYFKCRWAGRLESIHDMELCADTKHTAVSPSFSLPNFDRLCIAKRNWVVSPLSKAKKVIMGNRISISDQAHDVDFIREVVTEHSLAPNPSDGYWKAPDYWMEDERFKRVVERYTWGCVVFLSNKLSDEHYTVVFEELEVQDYHTAITESKTVPWYKELVDHFKRSVPQRPECFGYYIIDPVCDGGYNSRLKLMEAPCLWADECRGKSGAPERRTLEQLAKDLCEAISEVSGTPMNKGKGSLVIQPLSRKGEEGCYLKYIRSNGGKVGVMVCKYKATHLSVGLATGSDAHPLLQPSKWGKYQGLIKKLQTEKQFQAIIEVATQIIEDLKG